MNELINKLYDDNKVTIRMAISLGLVLFVVRQLDKK